MSGVSEESLLDYFYSTGDISGRVKNADILKTFKPFIGHSDVQLRAKYREEFKLIIDRIAAVKSENGEKYLVLKKKYRQMLQDRDARLHGTDGDAQRGSSPARAPAAAQWDASDPSTSSHQQKDPRDEPMLCGEQDEAAETGTASTQHAVLQLPVIQIQEPSNEDDELDKDSGSKSESEQDEESTGSMGSAAVALDPIEKEWIYSAAGARVPDLSQLLRQDPSLANKKDFTSQTPTFTALHWAAKHGNRDMAALVVNAGADVNTKSHGGYTPLHIAALHGHRHILDLLIVTYGAKENLRDYSGHLAGHYLNIREPEGPEEECELQFQVTQARERNRNRKLASLFHSKKRWGSAEELAPIEEERTASHQLNLPAFRPRKFSR
nr:ankyrin repeat domain-containing protein SOWAHC [Pseudochaenichthys georgianus]